MKTIGFIGMGNMASAIVKGVLQAGFLQGRQVAVYDLHAEKLQALAAEFPVQICQSAKEVADKADMVFLAVKPNAMAQLLADLGEHVAGKAVVSIALGWQFAQLRGGLPQSARVQAVMPNTPMLVGEGVCLVEETNDLHQEEQDFLLGFFGSIGIAQVVPTSLMGIGGALTGCGPAFAYQFIEALGDAAVMHGMPRKESYALAAQMLLGSAKMVLETGAHPAQLKDNVCSPGGSTIRGVAALEETGFRHSVITAVRRAKGEA